MSPDPFASPLMLAPMEGVTSPKIRARIAKHGGVGIVCTEFLRVSRAPLSIPRLKREVVKVPGIPLSVQVMGNEACKMAEAASAIAAAGAEVVDINLGCPMPRVVRKGVGAAMLKDQTLLKQVVCSMRAATPVRLSAKIRAGYDDSAGVLETAKLLEGCGIDYLVVHPRRRCDFYRGVADWRIVKALAESMSIPVIGNGDVWYAADARRMQLETGCAGVMIGRPALRNPWIFRQIRQLQDGESPFRPAGVDIVQYLHWLASPQGFGKIGPVKEQLRYLGRALPNGAERLKPLLRLRGLEELLDGAEQLFGPQSAEALDLGAAGDLGLEQSGSIREQGASGSVSKARLGP
ncbi:MAG: tRNA-dihydrouridine synthase family protein [Myxococcota bacterium]